VKLSIVLLTWDSRQFIPACLESLAPQPPHDKELIVVDNGSTDGSPQLVRRLWPSARVVANTANRGVGPARNQGLALARGEQVLVLDIDTVARPGALAALSAAMDAAPDVGVFGARLEDPEGRLQYTCRVFPTLWSKLGRQLPVGLGRRVLRQSELRDWDHASPRDVGYVIGACQLLRRAALDAVGGYDDRIFYGPEDVDLCLRMWRAGWRVRYEPAAVFTHYERRIARGAPWRSPLARAHAAGLAWYFWKHRYLLRAPRFGV
jgi:GT2 family glycosyltransferase